MLTNTFLLYGANGYTGQVTARMAKADGLSTILAGRNEAAIKKMARELKLELTAITSLSIVKQVMEGNFKAGFQTPSMVYGGEFVLGLEGVKQVNENH